MGALVVRHYPTTLFLKAADHTYVECGTGAKAWACWGGKTGGKYLRSAPGSTLRADAIAEPDEKAGITCYLINGVCHQAANRILTPAAITVDGARGYSLSVAAFGVYGRPRGVLGFCKAPFDNHPGVTGDLPECVGDFQADIDQSISFNPDRLDFLDERYMADVRGLYETSEKDALVDVEGLFEFQMRQFKLFVNHKLGRPQLRIDLSKYASLMAARERYERQRLAAEEELSSTRNWLAFVARFDELTLKFQEDLSEVLEPQTYQTLLNLPPDDRIVLSDPEIVNRINGGRPDFFPRRER